MALGSPSPKRPRLMLAGDIGGQNRNGNSHQSFHQNSVGHHQYASINGALPVQIQEYRKIQAERQNLPVFPLKEEIMREITKNSTTILIGETGSGKTTQIPQFIYESGSQGNRVIGVTQPRRVAAMSLSMRVAKEMAVELGHEVGYSVRFDSITSEKTKILYLTDGMLLREAILDPLLERYSVIILDEAHERTLHTDVLFAVVKEAQAYREKKNMMPLKVIVMSASMDVDHFSEYFNKAPVVYVEGRQYPVKLFYTARNSSDYIHDTVVSIFQLHQQEPVENGILVFLTGQDEIEQVVKKCRDVARELPRDLPGITILPLYAAMPSDTQLRVFKPVQVGRKIVIATNIAETSLTIPGIRLIIDSGKVKSRLYDAPRGIDMLKVGLISKAQACQRTGRAGREAPGTCYRLYTEENYESLQNHTMPEILRCNLSGIIVELLAMRISNIKDFDFMDKPKMEAIDAAVRELSFLGAVEEIDTSNEETDSSKGASASSSSPNLMLTQLGQKMSRFALDPKLSRMLLAASNVTPACTADMLTVVAIMSTDSFLLGQPQQAQHKSQYDASRKKYFAPEGDLISLLNMYRAYQRAKAEGKQRNWCLENYVNPRLIGSVEQIREQLKDTCKRLGISIDTTCGQDMHPLRKAICHGLFMNAAELDPSGDGYRVIESGCKSYIHPSSCLFQHKPAYVVFSELVMTSQLYIRDITVVDPQFLFDAAPEYFKQKHVKQG